MATIHDIGNCVLLEKNFNIAKSNDTLLEFLEGLYDFSQETNDVDAFLKNLKVKLPLTNPRRHDGEEIIMSIRERSREIKDELKRFIDNDISVEK